MLRICVEYLKFGRKSLRRFSTMSSVFEENQVKLEDSNRNVYNINYMRKGQGKDAIILLPGALGSAITDFQPQIDQLPDLLPNYSIIAWDPPGYGRSRPPNRTFSLDFFQRDAFVANSLMQTLKFNKYSILGWSDGGITGLLMAAKYNKSIDKLVIWGSNAYILPEELKIYQSIRDVSKWSSKMREPMEKMYGVEYFAQLWSEWVDAFISIYEKNNGNICKDELSQIEAKTLIVHGAKDPMIAAEHVPFLRKSIRNTEFYEFPNGKHNVHLRYAHEFNDLVAKFLLTK